MDVSVDGVRGGLTAWLPWRRDAGRPVGRARAISRVHVVYRIARWELVLTVVALFVLGRAPLLFMRLHTTELFWPVLPLWQEDLVVVCVLGAAELFLIAIAVRRSSVDGLLQHPFLLAFVGLAWLSVAWSVEPDVTMRRALLLAGVVGVGWYIGDRFSLRDQFRLVSWLGWSAVATTIVALFVWPDLARSTNSLKGQWSGIYVNRNSLGLVLSMGLLATLFFIRTSKHATFLRVIACAQFFMILATGSKTGLIGLAVAVSVAVVVAWLRRRRRDDIGTAAAAYIVFAVFATIGLWVHWYWVDILRRYVGRQSDLSGRTFVWEVVRWFTRAHPFRGWGFEAIWANRHAISQAQAAYNGSIAASEGRGVLGGWPFAAHNGYYEVLLGVGYIGLALLVGFLVFAAWRAFRYAWTRSDVESLWPLAFIIFAVVVNFSESLWVSGEAVFALTVAAAVGIVKMTGQAEPARADDSVPDDPAADTPIAPAVARPVKKGSPRKTLPKTAPAVRRPRSGAANPR